MVEKKRRPPGPIPDLTHMSWDQAKPLLADFLERIRDGYSGRPAPHASSHMGGVDNVTGTGSPSSIGAGNIADAGDATAGYAPFGHVHALSGDLEDLLGDGPNGLLGLEVDAEFGIATTDVKLRRILEKILIQLEALERVLM